MKRAVFLIPLVLLILALSYFLVTERTHSQQAEDSRDLFAAAYQHFTGGRLDQAQELFFRTLDDPNFALQDYSLYFLSQIQSSRQAYASARSTLIMLGEKFPKSVWASQARLQLARNGLAEGNVDLALRELKEIPQKSAKREVADEAIYLQGQIAEKTGNLDAAFSHYQTLRNLSPLSPWAAKARTDVRSLRERYPKPSLSSFDSRLEEARLLVREEQHDDAERLYRQLLESTRDGNLRPMLLMELANLQQNRRRRREETAVLAEIVEQHPRSAEASPALFRLARNYWNLDENAKALGLFDRLGQRYPGSADADAAAFASVQVYESMGDSKRAVQLYQEFSKKFPASKLRHKAQWRLGWIYYLRGDYDRAQATFARLAADKDKEAEGYRPAARYWQGRTNEKLGRPEEAKRIYLAVLSESEETYYKGPATRRLARLGAEPPERRGAKDSPPAPQVLPGLKPDTLLHLFFHLSRAHELASLSLHELAVAELDAMTPHADAPLLRLILMSEYERNEAYDRSVILANETQAPLTDTERYRFPLAYWERLRQKAAERGLDPYLVLALIRQESLFNPKALSPASAHGLMQLMPSTAHRMARQAGLESPPAEKLFEPELNITLGMTYLKQLMRIHNNNPVKALAAYNAGEKAVDRWEKRITAEDDEEFIERIPYEETRLYVKLVLRNYRIYQKLYPQQP